MSYGINQLILGSGIVTATGNSLYINGQALSVSSTGSQRYQSMFNFSTMPDSVGDAFFEPYSVVATNDLFRHTILRMAASNTGGPTVDAGVYGRFTVPSDYQNTPEVIIKWNASVISGSVQYGLNYRSILASSGSDAESGDASFYFGSGTAVSAVKTTGHLMNQVGISLSGNIRPGDQFAYYFYRGGGQAADTMTGSALVHDLLFNYHSII